MRDKLLRIALFIEQFVRRYWILLCGGFILLLLTYQVSKSLLPWNYASKLGKPDAVYWDAILLLTIAMAGTLLIVWWHDKVGRCLPWLIAGIVVLVSMSVWLQKDRGLEWIGADVPTQNYRAALLSLEIGHRELIATWNARANPRVEPNYMPYPHEVLERIDYLRLDWAVGTRWDRLDLPQYNNRMHLHPPGYPLALGAWLSLFGRSRVSALSFELFLKFCLVFVAILWSWRYISPDDSLNRVAVALLFATIPSLLLFVQPHAHELAAVLALMAIVLACDDGRAYRFMKYIAAGGLLTLALYTNFFYGLLLIAIFGIMGLSKTAWREGLPIAIVIGAGIVIAGFTAFGYYPWLTYFTGSQVSYYYRMAHFHGILSSVLDYIYLGFPLLLVTGLGLLMLVRLRGTYTRLWMLAVMLAVIAGAKEAFGLVAAGRYLQGLFVLLVPLLSPALCNLNLTKKQVLMIPITNFAFLMMVLFL